MSKKLISIIGLGWIGLPLAKELIESDFSVVGSTTTSQKVKDLNESGVPAIQFSLIPYPSGEGFQKLFQSETLVINIPPRTKSNGGEHFLEQMKFLLGLVENSTVKKIIFVSSSGVYPSNFKDGEYTEEELITDENTGNSWLWKAENFWKEKFKGDLTIIRFGGLLGDERVPGKYFSNKENVTGHTPVNYIHRQDSTRLIQFVIEKNLWNQTLNGVAPIHPIRKDVYEKNATDLGIDPPKSFAPQKDGEKRVISGNRIIELGFEFIFPNPLDFPYSL